MRRVAILLQPVMPDGAGRLLDLLGVQSDERCFNDLTPDDNWARADMLLFRGAQKAARAMEPLLDPGHVALVEARIEDAVLGFLCESYAAEGARDITALGGWRAYLKSIS